MGRESSDRTMAHSSIVLLQERFRQLQRVKEIREEKEMLKLFAQSDTSNSHIHKPSSHVFFQSELLHPLPQKVAAPTIPPSSHITCLSLWPDSLTTKRANFDIINTKNLSQLGHDSSSSLFYDVEDHENESSVDTSLHL